MKWLKYAQRFLSGGYKNIGEAWWVALHGPDTVHPVTVTEDPEGDYYGWRETGEAPNSFPKFIWCSLAQLDMCFPQGVPKDEIVRLSITAGHGEKE